MLDNIKTIIPQMDMNAANTFYQNATYKSYKKPFRLNYLITSLSSLILIIAVVITIVIINNNDNRTVRDTMLNIYNQTVLRTNENENLGLVEYYEAYKTNEHDVLVVSVTNSKVQKLIFEDPVVMVNIDNIEGYFNENNMLSISLEGYKKTDYKLVLKLRKGYFDEHTDLYENYDCDPHEKVEPKYYSFFKFYIYTNYVSDESKNMIVYGIPVELIK